MRLLSLSKSFIVLLSFILAVSACKKNTPCEVEYVDTFNLDTIYPSEYLAAYPGSWWEYDDGRRDECTSWENVAKQISVVDNDGCNTIFRNYVIVPKVNNHYVHGDFVFTSKNSATLSQKVGSLGDSWGYRENFDNSAWGSGHRDYSWSIDSLLDVKEVNGVEYEDVLFIRMKYSTYYDENWGGPVDYAHYYYARNIGAILYKYFEYYGEEFEPIRQWSLEDYYIAPH